MNEPPIPPLKLTANWAPASPEELGRRLGSMYRNAARAWMRAERGRATLIPFRSAAQVIRSGGRIRTIRTTTSTGFSVCSSSRGRVEYRGSARDSNDRFGEVHPRVDMAGARTRSEHSHPHAIPSKEIYERACLAAILTPGVFHASRLAVQELIGRMSGAGKPVSRATAPEVTSGTRDRPRRDRPPLLTAAPTAARAPEQRENRFAEKAGVARRRILCVNYFRPKRRTRRTRAHWPSKSDSASEV